MKKSKKEKPLKKYRLETSDGLPILGTWEEVNASAGVVYVNSVDGKNFELDSMEHTGECEIYWENQRHVYAGDEVLFVDSNFGLHRQSELVLKPYK